MLPAVDKLSAREKAGFLVAGLFMLALVMDWAIVQPVLGKLKILNLKINMESIRLEYNLRIKDMEPDVEREYGEISGLINASISPDETINELKGEIDELARMNGIELGSIDHREPQKVPFCEKICEEYTVEIGRFEAKQSNLIKFLNNLKNKPGLLRVVKLSIAPSKSADSVTGSMLITKIVKTADTDSPTPQAGDKNI